MLKEVLPDGMDFEDFLEDYCEQNPYNQTQDSV